MYNILFIATFLLFPIVSAVFSKNCPWRKELTGIYMSLVEKRQNSGAKNNGDFLEIKCVDRFNPFITLQKNLFSHSMIEKSPKLKIM